MPTLTRKDEETAVSASDVVLVVFDGVEVIDVAGPASVFSKAEQMHPGRYRLHIASPAGGTVSTNGGLSFSGTCSLQQLPASIDTLIVAGGDEPAVRAAILEQRIGAWLRQVAPRTRRMASVCSGAFALAAAGLLDGREATTHWRVCDQLQALRPQVRVQRERIYVHDGPVWTSAGVTTGIELALALVEDDLGHAVSMEIARTLALPMLRGGAQPQLTQALQAQASASHRLRELVAWIGTHPQDDLSVEALAERVQMSPRNFARAFAAETGCTPARFVEQVRVAAAAQLLRQTRWPQDRIASRSGFRSVDALQRAFARQHGLTPQAYRTHDDT
ncbi:DJ-1/PfpI family protein [Variovorax paradoxus]|uniref:Transcriptional regulator GlxA family with amidase domain n=1 Tax=Variovorax paradoxus TaxID=34073 RepID=A0AAW8EKL8_VARPD|nr:DJ-1/PfpI family protein [Variovorax paradoxus]MDP9972547.1 transcriptional regulator GlxA family with amidase domain [Variovorax paradoxus]